jgi:uncharacterized membrane protein YeiB
MPHKNSTLGNGMNKADLLKGFLLISGSVLVVYAFITLFTPLFYNWNSNYEIPWILCKLITLSAILDLLIFTISKIKDFIAEV